MKNISFTSKNIIIIGAIVLIAGVGVILTPLAKRVPQNTDQSEAATSSNSLTPVVFNKDDLTDVHGLVHNGQDIGQIYVKYIDSKHSVFSDLYLVQNVNGKNIIFYKITSDGFFGSGQKDFSFDTQKLDGFGGYSLIFVGNDFFVVQEIGKDQSKYSKLVAIYWDEKVQQFRSSFTIPRAVLDIINGESSSTTSKSK